MHEAHDPTGSGLRIVPIDPDQLLQAARFEILYNEYDQLGAFATASLLALVTLAIKTLIERHDPDTRALRRGAAQRRTVCLLQLPSASTTASDQAAGSSNGMFELRLSSCRIAKSGRSARTRSTV